MKAFLFTTLAMALVFSNVSAQTDPRIQQFNALPAKEALILYTDTGEPPGLRMEMMRAALRDKRMDLLTLMFKDHPSFLDLIRGLNEIPNSAFKDEVVVMMLQTESGFWKSEEPISNGSRGVSFENAIDPFAGVIAKHLPAITINEELFSTKANRGKLAAELKGAIATKSSSSLNEVELPKNDRSPHERQAESPTKDLNHMNSAPRSEERKRNNASDLEKPVPFTWWITASCIALLLLVFSAWFKARKSKSDG